MPPKKKGKKSAKDSKKKGKEGDLNDGDKLKLKTHEIDSLKDNLAFRKDFSRKSKAAYDEIKERLEETNNQIEEIESIHKASSAYLTYQYKTLQNEMGIKTHQLEAELFATRKKLEAAENLLKNRDEENKKINEEKDALIAELYEKNEKIQTIYDNIIQLTLDKFVQNLEIKKKSWEKTSENLQVKNKLLLSELGLKIHDI
jgi:hypothetical protein